MEALKVITSLLVLTLTGPTLGYPYTRGVVSRSSPRARDRQVMDSNLADYLGGYVQDQQYGLPEYQPAYRHEYVPERQRINAEALAAILPYLTNNNDDYAYDYNSYSDDDGTWYDDAANDDLTDSTDSDSAALLQFLLDHRSGRYSLEDLETLEREAEMEDNTENQLHALMAKKINKKSNMPLLGARQIPLAPAFMRQGQKEEALNIPSTAIRKPVFARQITTQSEQNEPQAKRNTETSGINTDSSSSISSSTSQQVSAVGKQADSVSSKAAPASSSSSSSSSSSTSSADVSADAVAQTTMTPYMQSKYDAFMKYLDRERKVRQNQDIEQETRPQPQKRFVTEQDSLSQQLASLKKSVA